MMFEKMKRRIKRFLVPLLSAALLLVFILPSAPSFGAAPPKDVLLVYDDASQKDVPAVADTLTYLGYSVYYRAAAESAALVAACPYVVYVHDGGGIAPAFLTAVRQSSAKIVAVGGGDITALASALSLDLSSTEVTGASADVTYSFKDGQKSFLASPSLPVDLLGGKFTYKSGTVTVGGTTAPLCARAGRLCAFSLFDPSSALFKAALAHEIALFKWPYNDAPHSYAQYIVFDDVYPFLSTQSLTDLVNYMTGLQLPYVLAVSPVYKNGDYPAMEHFCEVLRYAQANGAAIALKEPVSQKPTVSGIDNAVTTAYSIYSHYGVYPVALETAETSVHQTTGLAVMRRFRTVILTPGGTDTGWSSKEESNAVYADGHQLIAPALTAGPGGPGLESDYPTAVFLDAAAGLPTLRTEVQGIASSAVPLMSLWSSPQSVYTDTDVISYVGGELTDNGKTVSLAYTPFKYVKNYNYHRDIVANMMSGISAGNRRLMVVVAVILVLFSVLIALARYQNRKNFFLRPDDHKNRGAGK